MDRWMFHIVGKFLVLYGEGVILLIDFYDIILVGKGMVKLLHLQVKLVQEFRWGIGQKCALE